MRREILNLIYASQDMHPFAQDMATCGRYRTKDLVLATWRGVCVGRCGTQGAG
jgi:hypothetical protein